MTEAARNPMRYRANARSGTIDFTSDDISKGAMRFGDDWYLPIYAPQVGGYVVPALIELGDPLECFEAHYFHDGEFVREGEETIALHHCNPLQFIRYGLAVAEAQMECSAADVGTDAVAELRGYAERIEKLIEAIEARNGVEK